MNASPIPEQLTSAEISRYSICVSNGDRAEVLRTVATMQTMLSEPS
jgi:hypothetical protein